MVWRIRSRDIVLGLQGGVGNQLFQWAYATDLGARGRRVVFDTARLGGDRPFELGPVVPRADRLARPVGFALAVAAKAGILSDRSRMRLVRQRRSGFDPSVDERLDRTSYLLGYFQSRHYFEASADQVRAEVRRLLEGMLTDRGTTLAATLRDDPHSVAVHVRRGDYLQAANARHGVLGAAYYDAALAHAEALGHANRVWFSDDLDWVREHLARDGDRLCPADAILRDGGEIALMAACSTRIIANSSFSWWGGWLGSASTPRHPVIAPVAWFADGHSDASELVPESWVRL
jgi:hypothetical protein